MMDLSSTTDQIAFVVGAFVFLNCLTFLSFGIDKAFAEKGEWRIPEKNLLLLAFLGGSPGALAAQKFYRHKTRKQPFCSRLRTIVLVQIMLLLLFAVPHSRRLILEWIATMVSELRSMRLPA